MRSSSRSLARRSISARSMASARSSLSTPRRENTRTSTTVPVTPGGTLSEVSRTSERSEEHTSELQSLMRLSYAVFCLTKKHQQTVEKLTHHQHTHTIHTTLVAT